MAGNLTSLSNNGIAAGKQSVSQSGSERQAQKAIGDLGKALHANDLAAAQTAVASLKAAAPTQNARTDFQNAVKALDQALKSGNVKGATEAFANVQQARKQIQQQQLRGPARDVPQGPNVSGGADTQQLQKRAQVRVEEAGVEKAVLARRDLAAKAANARAEAGIGTKIDTTA